MASSSRPHPKNVPGDFYVEDGCCTACGIPEGEAPDHFTFADDGQCYVKRQPCTTAETNRMLNAMWASEMKCIRYRGSDPAIFARLGAMGEPDLCDFPPSDGIPIVLRNHVAFGSIDQRPVGIEEAVADFRSYWMNDCAPNFPNFPALRHKFRGPRRKLLRRLMWFEISWYEDRYHRISIVNVYHDSSRIVMFHSPTETAASRGLSSALSRWLAQSKRFGDQRWYSAEEWNAGIAGAPTPW
jgi:hypothetical protein